MIKLAIASMRARTVPIILVLITLITSMALLISAERLQVGIKNGFNQSLSGVDLVIGPRSSGIEMLLYTVFHLGRPTKNITIQTIEDLESIAEVDWVVPIALGDSHKGFRVIATTSDYFQKVKYRGGQSFIFQKGEAFNKVSDVVLGSAVVKKLGYQIGSSIFVTHGSGKGLAQVHDDFAFSVTGILEPTGTPSDHAVFVSLEGYELIHLGWGNGSKTLSLKNIDLTTIPPEILKPKSITAAYLGLASKLELFRVAKVIHEYPEEAVSAVIPGLVLAELWSIIGKVDKVFKVLNWLIIGISIIGMITMTVTSLDSRTREMSILRAIGASPKYLSSLVLIESLFISCIAIIGAIVLVATITWVSKDVVSTDLGIELDVNWINSKELGTLFIILFAGTTASLFPAMMVYRRSLHEGFRNN